MSIEIKVPTLPESVTDATVAKWHKKVGDSVTRDENLMDLETDKIMLEVPASSSGIIEKIVATEGSTVKAGELLAIINETATATSNTSPVKETATPPQTPKKTEKNEDVGPGVRRLVAETQVDINKIQGTGKDGRVTKPDVENYMQTQSTGKTAAPAVETMGGREEKRVPMSRLRARIAERLVQVQNEAAILTTFNEVNMKAVIDLRNKYKDSFEKIHGIRLGFMSFFTKATVEALKHFPVVNASIDGHDLIYHNYYDIGIAVGSPRGLVVPILRNVDTSSLATIEKQIKDYSEKAKDGKLSLEEMTGGTFTISNGGVFGSMLSTPIINPPQTAILGMHNIVERPVAENGQVVIRPIMYLALSYDHRVIDARDSVSFLKMIKELIEEPTRMLLDV